jgi:hypothetical protein
MADFIANSMGYSEFPVFSENREFFCPNTEEIARDGEQIGKDGTLSLLDCINDKFQLYGRPQMCQETLVPEIPLRRPNVTQVCE